jgi:hypothetical protein
MISDTDNSKALDKTDVKCRFFSQYWGQLYEFKNTKTKWRVDEGAFPLEKEGNERLILTDLKNIQKEDLYFICRDKKTNITDIELLGIEENKGMQFLNIKTHFSNGWSEFYLPIEKLNHIDYLRSKGYALPFMEYSIKDLISFDWVRLV